MEHVSYLPQGICGIQREYSIIRKKCNSSFVLFFGKFTISIYWYQFIFFYYSSFELYSFSFLVLFVCLIFFFFWFWFKLWDMKRAKFSLWENVPITNNIVIRVSKNKTKQKHNTSTHPPPPPPPPRRLSKSYSKTLLKSLTLWVGIDVASFLIQSLHVKIKYNKRFHWWN